MSTTKAAITTLTSTLIYYSASAMVFEQTALALVETVGCEAKFSLTGQHFHPSDSIVITGTFTQPSWSVNSADGAIPMIIGGDGIARATAKLPAPGQHEYRFVINGTQFLEDPDNPTITADGFGGFNNIVACEDGANMQCAVDFSITANATGVRLAGTMFIPEWDEVIELQQHGTNEWHRTLTLFHGEAYQFKFVDNQGHWLISDSFSTVTDANGNINNMLTVDCHQGDDEPGEPPAGGGCEAIGLDASCDILPERSIVVTDVLRQVADEDLFSFMRVMEMLAQTMTGDRNRATELFQSLFRDDNCELSINGLTAPCRDGEASLANLDPRSTVRYTPTGLFNRFDLAPADGSHCGEYRITYAKTFGGPGRHFIIFEAELPNPNPNLGLAGCDPIASFWAELTTINDIQERARRLAAFYFEGVSGLPPVIQAAHFGSGTGQIRLNQFMSSTWNFRQFEVADNTFVPVPVDESPEPTFFNGNNPAGADFRDWFIREAVPVLARDVPLTSIATANNRQFNALESNASTNASDYFTQARSSTFVSTIQATLDSLGSNLNAQQLLNRATTMSCAGCHQLSNVVATDLGGQMGSFTKNLSFVMIDENRVLDNILIQQFIPARESNLENFLRAQ